MIFRSTVYDCTDNFFHNRVVISNNFYIACPAGFDLLDNNNQAIKETNISIIYPNTCLSIKWARQDMANNLKIARDIFNQREGYRSYIIPPKSTDDNPLLLLPAKS